MDIIVIIIIVGMLAILITMGNERNRAAIAAVNQTAQEWAEQDLRLKRGTAARVIDIPDPISWFQQVVTRATGEDTQLQLAGQFAEQPACIVFSEAHSGMMYIFSPHSAKELRRILKAGAKKASRLDDVSTNPLDMSLPKSAEKTSQYLNLVNSGYLFDLELPVVWERITGRSTKVESLWLYKV